MHTLPMLGVFSSQWTCTMWMKRHVKITMWNTIMPILHALVYKCKLWIYVYIVYICTLCISGCDPHFKEAWRKKQEEQKLTDFNNNIESDPPVDMPQSCTFWWNLHHRKYMLTKKMFPPWAHSLRFSFTLISHHHDSWVSSFARPTRDN